MFVRWNPGRAEPLDNVVLDSPCHRTDEALRRRRGVRRADRRSCATKVGSPGIQFPITIRPPGRVTRTISFATSFGRGANIAPKIETTRSKLSSARSSRFVASPPWNFRLSQPELLCPRVARRDEVLGDVDAENVRARLRLGDGGRTVTTAEVKNVHARGDTYRPDERLAARRASPERSA